MYIQEATSCKKCIRQTIDYKKRNKKTEKKLITKERTKEQRERITIGESPSPKPIKKGTTEKSDDQSTGHRNFPCPQKSIHLATSKYTTSSIT